MGNDKEREKRGGKLGQEYQKEPPTSVSSSKEEFYQRKEREVQDVIGIAQQLEEKNQQIRDLEGKLSQVEEKRADEEEITEIKNEIKKKKAEIRRLQAMIQDYLGFETNINSFEDLLDLINSGNKKGNDLIALKILRDSWIQAEIDRLRQTKVRKIIDKIEILASQQKRDIGQRMASWEKTPVYSYQILAQLLDGSVYSREVYQLVKDLPASEARFLIAYFQNLVEKSPVFKRLQESLSLNWGEMSVEEQKAYIKEKIISIRNSNIEPSMITSSPAWLDLVQRMADERTYPEVKDLFNNHFNLLKYYVTGRNLADANLRAEEFVARLDVINQGVIHGLFQEKEIQTAYDVWVDHYSEVMRVNTEKSLWDLIDKYYKEYLKRLYGKEIEEKGPTEKQINEAKASLSEAFDLFYIFHSLQDVESSKMKPDSVRKALSMGPWMRGKFAPELVEAFSKLRFYRKDKNNQPVPVGKDESEFQRINAGTDKPFHALFSTLTLEDFERMGFTVSRNEEPIYDFHDRLCFSLKYERNNQGKWEKRPGERVSGTYIFTGKDENGNKIGEVEALIKDDGKLVVVRVSDIRAETLARVFRLKKMEGGRETPESIIDQKWLGNYGKNNIIYGENTRLLYLKTGLLSIPAGAGDGELKDPLKRLADAAESGDFYGQTGFRYAGNFAPYELAKDDFVEIYLDAVLKISKNRRSGKFMDNTNFIIGGDPLRSVIINEARRRGYLTDEGEDRLTKEHFGGWLQRYFKRTIGSIPLIVAWRYPGMKAKMLQAGWSSFWEFFKAYVFEGTGMEEIFGGKAKPKR